MSASPEESKNDPNEAYETNANHAPDDLQGGDEPLQPVYFTPEPVIESKTPQPPTPDSNPTVIREPAGDGDSNDNDENVANILSNVIAPSCIGGLGAVGLIAIGLNAPSKQVQVTSEDGTTSTTVAQDYLPSVNMGVGAEFFLYSCIVVMLATLIGSMGVLSLIGVPKKAERAKTWQIGIVYALLFPTAISALIQNQFLGGQQASVETLIAEQEDNLALQNSTIEDIQVELQQAHQQLRLSTEIIAAPELYSFPQQNLVIGNQQAIAELDRLQIELEDMKK